MLTLETIKSILDRRVIDPICGTPNPELILRQTVETLDYLEIQSDTDFVFIFFRCWPNVLLLNKHTGICYDIDDKSESPLILGESDDDLYYVEYDEYLFDQELQMIKEIYHDYLQTSN